MKNLFYLFLFISSPLLLMAQDISQAEALSAKADQAIESGDLENAHTLLTEATTIYEKAKKWDAYLDGGARLVDNLIKAGEYEMGKKAATTFIAKAKEVNYQDISLSLLNKNLGKIYYINDDYKSALPYLEEALTIREKINKDDPELARDYGNLGIISRYSGRSNKAVEYLDKATTLQKDDNVLARLYSELGTNYNILGNYRKSLDNQNQALRILESGNDAKAKALALFEKGAALAELKQEGEDLIYVKQALEIFKSPEGFDYTNQMNCYLQIANSYFQFRNISLTMKGGLDSAQLYFEKALTIATQHLAPNNPYTPKIMLNLSTVLTKKNQFDAAQAKLNQSQEILLANAVPKSLDVAQLYEIKGKFFVWQGNYIEALNNYQKQIIALIDDYNEADIYKLPSEEQAKKSLSHDKITDALSFKARCFYQFYKYGGKDKKNLEAGLKTIRLFDALVNHIRADFANSGSNIAWSDITLDAYENAIEICMALAKETKDDNYYQQALYFSEKSKGLTLLEAFQNTKATEVAGLSAEDLKKEREMKLDIADLEQQVFQLTQQRKPALAEQIKSLNKEIFIKREAYQDFLKDLETNNPQYYNTKYKLDILDLAGMRALLKDDQAFVEYFVGDSSVYAFKITKTEFEAFELDGEESMMARVGDLRQSIYGYFLSSKDRSDQMKSKYAKQYADRAYKMYQKIVEPLGALPKRLIIIPAGPMCDMPFEPLLTQQVSAPDKFKSHPYFVKDHIISYSYSATLLREMMDRKHSSTPGTYLGFAPSFGESAASVIRGKRFSLSPLAFNKPEIENINTLLGRGTIFKDEAATENQFKEVASDFQIIHFATHGMANSNDPDYSLLAFTEIKDDHENEFLYVSDLYNLELRADMVVLSACETALGKNFRGEGIMSLARGFSYAGAKSIFTTLWSVNDHSTYNIIKGYFKHLKAGMDKDEALQQSKLDYIEGANNFTCHPFLWSPYILIGDTDPIPSIVDSFPWTYLVGGGLGLLLFGFLGLRVMKKKEIV